MEWRDVVGYEGIYEVSNTGEVRTKEGKTTHSALHGVRVWKQRVLKQKISKDGTCRVCLWKDKKPNTLLVHRLVAEAFIPKVEGKEYINHIDGSRLNNDVSNLEWCDHKENNNHAFDTGLMTSNNRVILMNDGTGEIRYFRSLSKASLYLGRNEGYLSNMLNNGKYKTDNHSIFLEVERAKMYD